MPTFRTLVHAVRLLALPLAAAGFASHVTPDIAPLPTHRSGHSLTSPNSTRVAMTAERVDLTLHADHADVVAWFELIHQGDVEEVLAVGFPTQARPLPKADLHAEHVRRAALAGAGFQSEFLFAFVATVDGAAVEHQQLDLHRAKRPADLTGEISAATLAEHQHWVAWRMSFAPGQRREVTVRYQVTTRDDAYLKPFDPLGPRELLYVLKTGAGWHGTIGRAEIRVHLGDGLFAEQIEICEPVPDREPSAQSDEGDPAPVRQWLFEDFEPDQDLRIRYRVYRDAEHAVDGLRRNLAVTPDDSIAAFDLAQNLENLGKPAGAAVQYAKLAAAPRPPKNVHSRMDGHSFDWHAARCFLAAKDQDGARRHGLRLRERQLEAIARWDEVIRRHTQISGVELSDRAKAALARARERKAGGVAVLDELNAWLAKLDG